MEILSPAQYEEYERFVKSHPNGNFTQSARRPKVKDNWKSEIVVYRGEDGAIRGGMLLLYPGLVTDIIGLAIIIALSFVARSIRSRHAAI